MSSTKDGLGYPGYVVLCAAIIAFVGAAGCGSDEPSGTSVACGPGTTLVGGLCVPEGGMGGQGGTGGAGGSGGTESDSAAAGQGGTGGDAPDGDVDSSIEDGPSDVQIEGMPWPEDDPCPTEAMFLNCSDSCGEMSAECAASVCANGYEATLTSADQFPVTLRTPSRPGMNATCQAYCDAATKLTAASLVVKLNLKPTLSGTNSVYGVRITVASPWVISFGQSKSSNCVDHYTKPDCNSDGLDFNESIYISTADPDAPARNVTIEHLENPISCP